MIREQLLRIVVATICLTSASLADTVLETGSGVAYTIDTESTGALSGPDNFQTWPLLCVKNCSDCDDACTADDLYNAGGLDATPSLNGRQLALGQDFLANVLVQRKIYVPATGGSNFDSFVRYVDSFKNTTDQAITITVYLGSESVQPDQGRLGSDDARVQRSHHFDDDQIEPNDRWLLLDDADPMGGYPAVGTLVWGGGGLAPFEHKKLEDASGTQVRWGFRLTLPPNGTRSLMTLITTDQKRLDALAEVKALLRVDVVALLNGLSDDERREIANFDVDPANSAPIADAGGRYVVNEGSSVTIQGGQSIDVEGAPLTYGWHLTPTADLEAPFDGTQSNIETAFTDNGFYPVRLTVSDDLGKRDRVYAGIQVNNVAPTIDSFTTSSPIGEGESLVVKVIATDPGADTLTYYYDWSNSGAFGESMPNETEKRFTADGIYTVRAMVRDDDGGSRTAQATIEVQNLAPNILQVVLPPEVGEEQIFPITIIAQDPGADPIRYSVDLDDDGDFERVQDGDPTFLVSYPDDGFYSIAVKACDDADECQTKTATVSVGNLPPVINAVSVTSPIEEGGTAVFSVEASDSAADLQQLSYGFDFNNDGDYADDLIQASPETSYRFLRAGTYPVGIRVSDSDGGVSTTSVSVTVTNLDPSVVLQGPLSASEGQRVNFTCQGSDQSSDFLAIDWDLDGDGGFERPNTTDQIEHSFDNEGTYQVRCRVRDGSGGSAIGTHEILVSNVAPQVAFEVSGALVEGGEVIVRVQATDPSSDALVYRFDFDGDGTPDGPSSESNIGRHTYRSEGVYSLTIWVSDGTDETRVVGQIAVANRAPNIILIMEDEIDEGGEVTLRAEVSDPGDDPIRLEWDLDGDGVAEIIDDEPVQNGVAERTFSFADNGRYNLSVWAYDDEDAFQLASASLTVRNVAPSLLPGYMPLPAREGEQYASVIPVFDPAGPADPLAYQLLAGPANIDLDPVTGLLLWTPTYEEYLASPTFLTVRISDGDTGVLEINLTIIVLPLDQDMDGLPDTYESRTCDDNGACLDPNDPDDANSDLDNDGLTNLEEWAGNSDPFHYDGPSTPTLLSPPNGERVNTTAPTLEVEVEPYLSERQAWVQFEVYADEALTARLGEARLDIEDDSIIGWRVEGVDLSEDTRYFWRARSESGISQTDWSESFSFIINAVNQPPPPPVLLGPSDDAVLSERSPTFTASTVVDGDGDQLRYLFRFYRPNGDIETLGYGQVEDDLAVLTQTHREGVTLNWEVIAVDEVGAQSAGGVMRSFTIDALNSAPSKPTILSPEDRGFYDKNPIEVRLAENEDSDGHDFKYVVSIYGDDVEPLTSGEVEPAADGSATYVSDMELEEDRGYNVVVYAEDEFEARSESAVHRFFLSSENDPPTRPSLLGPVNLAPLTQNQTVLTWEQSTDPEGSPITYRVTACTQDPSDLEDYSSCFVESLIQTNGFDFRGASRPGETYYWFVEAVDDSGLSSEPSDVWQFKVVVTDVVDEGCTCRVSTRPDMGLWLFMVLMLLSMYGGVRRNRH